MEPFEEVYGKRCKTHLRWYDFGKSVVLGHEIVQQNYWEDQDDPKEDENFA